MADVVVGWTDGQSNNLWLGSVIGLGSVSWAGVGSLRGVRVLPLGEKDSYVPMYLHENRAITVLNFGKSTCFFSNSGILIRWT